MLQGVIFDLGETLIHFEGDWDDVFREARMDLLAALEEQGVELDRERFLSAFKLQVEQAHAQREQDQRERPTADLLRQVMAQFGYQDVEATTIETAVEHLYRVSQRHWQPFEGACETVAELFERGYRLAIISNAADVADVHNLVDKVGVREYLDPIVVSAGIGVRKPAREIFVSVLRTWDLPPQEVVMVGDTLNADILGAQRAGIHNIWVRSAQEREDNLEWRNRVEPEAVVDHISDVPRVIGALSRKAQGV